MTFRLSPILLLMNFQHMGDFFAYAGMQAAWDIRKHYFHRDFRTWAEGKITAAQQKESPPFLYREGSAQTR